LDVQGKEVALCDIKHDVQPNEILNLIAPTNLRPLVPEYQRLAADITKELGSLNRLATAREDQEQKDLTFLASATGWDARLVALAATALRLSGTSGLSPDLLYALMRAGLPTDANQLARIKIEEVETALKEADASGIVQLNASQTAAAKSAFQKFAAAELLAGSTPGALSGYNELLGKSGLTPAQQAAFAQLYFAQGNSPDGFWQKVEALGISKDQIATLQLQGKLYYLTLNNGHLAVVLQQEVGTLANLAKLVDSDLHEPEQWKVRLNRIAGNNEAALAALIPPTYGSGTTADRLEAYAADLARRVRLSYPTHVAARMLARGQTGIQDKAPGSAAPVAGFLKLAASHGFELGRTPIGHFLAQNQQKLLAGMKADEIERAVPQVKQMHRLYQVTPSDESFKSLLDLGLKSAHVVARLPYETFMTRYGHRFPSLHEADLVYRKSQQVTTTTLNFFSMAKSVANSPGIFAMSAPTPQREVHRQNLVKQYPTMESLFGSLDFCQCEECRSVLGPAAYLVDLLRFLDPDPTDWQHFLSDWSDKHLKAPYPFHDQAEMQAHRASQLARRSQPDSKTQKTPYEVFIERRPDIPNLPLTCENTNTVMPYIDIVNEVLEYFVVHDSLSATSGHDTGEAPSEELLAEPQNILPLAYDKLAQARYPLGLPFDLWLETVRRFLNHFDVKLSHLLEIFAQGDELFAGPKPDNYGWSDIFIEYLGLSPSEYALFTDQAAINHWFSLYGYNTEVEALSGLSSAKTLSERLRVSYLELVSIVKGSFVNPGLASLVVLRKLGLEPKEVLRYYQPADAHTALSTTEREVFEQRLADRAAAFHASGTDAQGWLETAWRSGNLNRVLVLVDPDTGCDFSKTTLRYLNGAPADGSALLRINLFVRLWKKVGWVMEDVDRALEVLLPSSYFPLSLATIGPAFKAGLIYLAHLKVLDEKLALGRHGRQKLLPLWSNLPTTGKNPLYAQLFLTRSILKTDTVFEDPAGNYLAQPGLLVAEHLPGLEGALSLTARDIGLILQDAGMDVATATLSLDTVSLLYRCGMLAKALKLSVEELIALKALSGLNPFKPVKPDALSGLQDDYPFCQTLRFVEQAGIVRESGFHVADLDFLLRHRFDAAGKYRQDTAMIMAFVRPLAASLRGIQKDLTVPTDVSALTDDLLQQKLGLVLPGDAVTTFMGMWNGTVQYDVVQKGVVPTAQLDPNALSQFPAVSVSYDNVLQVQRLSYHGVLTAAQLPVLTAANSSPVFAALLNAVAAAGKDYCDKYLGGFLTPDDFQSLFAAPATSGTDADKQKALAVKRLVLAQKLFPYLQRQLSRQTVIQALTAALGADASLLQTLASNPNLFCDPKQPGAPLTDNFFPLGEESMDSKRFSSNDGSGDSLEAASGASSAAPAPNSIRQEGYFEVPTAGPYRFFAQLGKVGAQAQLKLDFLPDPLIQGAASKDGDELSGMVELKTNVAYRFTFDGQKLGGGPVKLLVQGESVPKDVLSQLTLYSKTSVDLANRSRLLLAKAFQLSQTFGLDEREVCYLLANRADFDGLDFGRLPASIEDDSPGNATLLFQQFLRLAAYARLKRETGASYEIIDAFENAQRTSAAGSATDPKRAQADLVGNLNQSLMALFRREEATVTSALNQLSFSPAFAVSGGQITMSAPNLRQEKGLLRLWDLLQIMQTIGVPAQALARWATPAPDSTVARDLRETVKACYEPENWLVLAPSIFDPLRKLQRDGLVAYITFTRQFQDSDELFDYFLLDPGMEPVVQTSRLRLALSSLQTFIQRCFLNLEPQVQPTALNAEQWEWMKRYRVWQANREIFLFPENWLEPEFRDDKTDLFQELEGSLLQGDVTDDLAEDALFTYIKKLEVISQLDIVCLCCDEDPNDPGNNTLHVIGRTQTDPRNYFHRRYAQQMWTPWEPITVNITGAHVVVTIWHNRLNLFWLTFIEQVQTDGSGGQTQPSPMRDDDEELGKVKMSHLTAMAHKQPLPPKNIQVQLNWAEYFQGKWTTPGSSGGGDGADDSGDGSSVGSVGNPLGAVVEHDFHTSSVSVHATTEHEPDGAEAVKINVHFDRVQRFKILPPSHTSQKRGKKVVIRMAGVAVEWVPWSCAFKLVSKHSPPQIVGATAPVEPPFPHSKYAMTHYWGTNPFQVHYLESIQSINNQAPKLTYATTGILQQNGRNAGSSHKLTLLPTPVHAETPDVGVLVSPFFFADSQHTFYVEPSLTETTIDQWEHWAIPLPHLAPQRWGINRPRMVAAFPRYRPALSLQPGMRAFNGAFDPASRFRINAASDALTHAGGVLHFGSQAVLSGGGTGAAQPRTPLSRPAPKPTPPVGARR
jgi:hypothetical protein